jgi:hypothetical protein
MDIYSVNWIGRPFQTENTICASRPHSTINTQSSSGALFPKKQQWRYMIYAVGLLIMELFLYALFFHTSDIQQWSAPSKMEKS